MELFVLLGCEYGYKPINNSTYIQAINNLNLTTGVQNMNLTTDTQNRTSQTKQNRTSHLEAKHGNLQKNHYNLYPYLITRPLVERH